MVKDFDDMTAEEQDAWVDAMMADIMEDLDNVIKELDI